MTRDDDEQAVFGLLDGLASAIGMIAALAIARPSAVLVAAVALAVGAAVSMATGKWLSDPQASVRRAVIIGLATLTGALAPAIPFAFGHGPIADATCVMIVLVCVAMIAELRPGGRRESYAQTVLVLVLACGAAVIASIAAGSALTG